MEKKRVYKIVFETVFDKKEDKSDSVLTWRFCFPQQRTVRVVADDIEGALAYARKNFIELASKLELENDEHVVDIREVSLDISEVYA